MRMRHRPAFTGTELEEVYPAPHCHWNFPDHVLRVEHTISIARQLMKMRFNQAHLMHLLDNYSVADLACGDATIPRALCKDPVLGDFAAG